MSPHVQFIIVLIFDFYTSKIMHLCARNITQTERLSVGRTKAEQRARVD